MDGLSSTLKSNGEAVLLGKRNNCLLVKDDVGRGKPTTRDLPKGQFTFGKPENRDAESAADVTQKWSFHQQSRVNQPDPRDFKKLNKMCVKQGAFTSKQNREFRNDHDARIPFGVINEKSMLLPGEEFTFGRANRPQTPVGSIIANDYGESAVNNQQTKYQHWKKMRSTQRGLTEIRMTNAQMHADHAVKAKNSMGEPKAEFKLKRFQNVDPRTSTKRGQNAFMTKSPAPAARHGESLQ